MLADFSGLGDATLQDLKDWQAKGQGLARTRCGFNTNILYKVKES